MHEHALGKKTNTKVGLLKAHIPHRVTLIMNYGILNVDRGLLLLRHAHQKH